MSQTFQTGRGLYERTAQTHTAIIWIAGEAAEARRICRKHCVEINLCVTVTPTTFVYTGGCEKGVCVRLVNYPRRPCGKDVLEAQAMDLARALRTGLCQETFLVETPTSSTWVSTEAD